MEIFQTREIYLLADRLYLPDADKYTQDIVNIIQKVSIYFEKGYIKNKQENLAVIVNSLLKAIEIKDWILAGDLLKYELAGFAEGEDLLCLR